MIMMSKCVAPAGYIAAWAMDRVICKPPLSLFTISFMLLGFLLGFAIATDV
jgi:hypothetical protein